MSTMTMTEIETLTRQFADARDELASRLDVLREEQAQAKRRRLQGIKNALDRVQARHEDLHAAIEAHPDLFDKPKTRVLHGIRVGWIKQRGKLDIADPDATVKALRKLLGDEAEAYIRTTEAPIKPALANLPAKDLQRCGVAVADDVDAVVIKAANGDLDKLIDALINDQELEQMT